MSTVPNRLQKLEDHFGLGACQRCQDRERSGFDIVHEHDEHEEPAPPVARTCPDCGQPEPPPSFTIVFTTRPDGPQ